MKPLWRKAVAYFSHTHNVRSLLWKTRRVMLVAAAVVETLLKEQVADILPA